VQFTQPLAYGASYRVSVSGVVGLDDGQASTITTAFTTPTPHIYYLKRSGSSAPDQIIRTDLRTPGSTTVFRAARISSFAVFPQALAVVTLDKQGESALEFVASDGTTESIDLPGPGTIDQVHGNADTGVLGFTFTSAGAAPHRQYTDTLFMVNPAGTAVPTPVKALDGSPLSALSWFFVPASSELVVQDYNESVQILDTTNPKAVVPLGNYLQLDSIANDGKSIVAEDINGPVKVALPSGRTIRLTPSILKGARPLGGAAQVIPAGWVQIDSTYDSKTQSFLERLAVDDGVTTREVFRTVNLRGEINSFSLSPNNEYVAIETTPDVSTSAPDGYAVNGRSTAVTTELVDLHTGRLVKDVEGFDLSW
jgi:LysM repeat protein